MSHPFASLGGVGRALRLALGLTLLVSSSACDLSGSSPEGRWTMDAEATWNRSAQQLPSVLDELAQATRRRALEDVRWEFELRSDGTLSSSVGGSSSAPILLEGSWATEAEDVLLTLVDPRGVPQVIRAKLENDTMWFSPPEGLGLPAVEFAFSRSR
ncbi:MAG: hypothetical protein AAF196_08790 [Planctomycetota bacterium]